jgi:hypothetical protein
MLDLGLAAGLVWLPWNSGDVACIQGAGFWRVCWRVLRFQVVPRPQRGRHGQIHAQEPPSRGLAAVRRLSLRQGLAARSGFW